MNASGLRLEPRNPNLFLDKGHGETGVLLVLPDDDPPVLSVDIYAFQPQIHPDTHLGFWHFSLGKGAHELKLRFDFSSINESSVRAFEGENEIAPGLRWFNPDYRLAPVQDAKFVFWSKDDQILLLKRFLIKCGDPSVLRDFHTRQFETEGYHPEAPFLDRLYHFKLHILRRYFNRYFRGRVLDVGCGLSLFTQIRALRGLDITAGDIVPSQVSARKKERADIHWAVFDAAAPPFRPESFDGIFAGEILEHLPRPQDALKQWNRMLRPDGILILTTPNRLRRTNLLNGENWPYSPDHLREFSFDEINHRMLPAADFKPVKEKGIYLELRTRSKRWWTEDPFQREGNTRRNLPFMWILYRVGFLFPWYSLDLVTVARKIRPSN